MTSPTDKTENRRLAKKVKGGKKSKNKLRKIGTTPALFALDKPVASSAKK